jgi:hypothetical protein
MTTEKDLADRLKIDEATVRAAKLTSEELADHFGRAAKAQQRHNRFFTPGLSAILLAVVLNGYMPISTAHDPQEAPARTPQEQAELVLILGGFAAAAYAGMREKEHEIRKKIESRASDNLLAAYKAGKLEP